MYVGENNLFATTLLTSTGMSVSIIEYECRRVFSKAGMEFSYRCFSGPPGVSAGNEHFRRYIGTMLSGCRAI